MILSGGAIGSPHILQLSGVGDPDHLGRIGVPVAHALPGVGKNLQDHFLARVTAEVTGIPTANEKSRGLPFVGELMRYVFAGTGPADLRRLAGRGLGQGAGGVGDPRRADPVRQCQLRAGSDPPARRRSPA